jgi:hypothetical protein
MHGSWCTVPHACHRGASKSLARVKSLKKLPLLIKKKLRIEKEKYYRFLAGVRTLLFF